MHQTEVLGECHSLMMQLFAVCPNGLLPAKFLQQALCASHARKFETGQKAELWALECGINIRIVAAHYRDLADKEFKKAIALKKAYGEVFGKNKLAASLSIGRHGCIKLLNSFYRSESLKLWLHGSSCIVWHVGSLIHGI